VMVVFRLGTPDPKPGPRPDPKPDPRPDPWSILSSGLSPRTLRSGISMVSSRGLNWVLPSVGWEIVVLWCVSAIVCWVLNSGFLVGEILFSG
jgi:hypothetical protein